MRAFMAPDTVQRASRKPTTISTTPPFWFSIAAEAVADERDRLLRDDAFEWSSIDWIVSGPADLGKHADGHEEDGGNREEGVVGKGGGDVGDRVRLRLLGAANEE